MLKLSFGDKYFVFKTHYFTLLFFKFLFFSFKNFILLLVSMDAIFFGFFLSDHNLIHLLGKLIDLRFELNILLNHFLSVWIINIISYFFSLHCFWLILRINTGIHLILAFQIAWVILAHLNKIFIILFLRFLFLILTFLSFLLCLINLFIFLFHFWFCLDVHIVRLYLFIIIFEILFVVFIF